VEDGVIVLNDDDDDDHEPPARTHALAHPYATQPQSRTHHPQETQSTFTTPTLATPARVRPWSQLAPATAAERASAMADAPTVAEAEDVEAVAVDEENASHLSKRPRKDRRYVPNTYHIIPVSLDITLNCHFFAVVAHSPPTPPVLFVSLRGTNTPPKSATTPAEARNTSAEPHLHLQSRFVCDMPCVLLKSCLNIASLLFLCYYLS
jgi:hypothetical protein